MDELEILKNKREEVYKWAISELLGKEVLNQLVPFSIYFNKRGIKHTIKGKSYSNPKMYERNFALLESVIVLKELVENADYTGSETDNRNRVNITQIHKFEFQASTYEVEIIARETPQGIYFYDHSLYKKALTPKN